MMNIVGWVRRLRAAAVEGRHVSCLSIDSWSGSGRSRFGLIEHRRLEYLFAPLAEARRCVVKSAAPGVSHRVTTGF